MDSIYPPRYRYSPERRRKAAAASSQSEEFQRDAGRGRRASGERTRRPDSLLPPHFLFTSPFNSFLSSSEPNRLTLKPVATERQIEKDPECSTTPTDEHRTSCSALWWSIRNSTLLFMLCIYQVHT
ncbi:hypothetical protein F2P81_026249 [Scophthalmus maximus]|uniref:Uncharacterized protein n=1 Tax=Scophthalmus maximus TaxID=52904 RepID=A0A6A4RMX7_SCOMX|nr:hypothetical protein F2P81_026249 [Scophthalmus maximus]